jgi:aspartokinase/homoserine dehydrogenase 1
MKVLKFGGTSVGTPERIRLIKDIAENQAGPRIIVVSALSDITDQLIAVSKKAAGRDESYKQILEDIHQRHYDTVKGLFKISEQPNILAGVKVLLNELEEILNGIYLLKEMTDKTLDTVLSFGERLSSFIISLIIDNAILVDARDLIRTDRNFGKAGVDFVETNKLITNYFKSLKKIAVVPGFIASTSDGEITTLGRGGSDYTAAILAAALDAEVLEIWKDVNGFMTADPRKVEKAYTIDTLTYAEAMELSHFGAKVISTPTIQPAFNKKIRIHIRNTFNPSHKGTIIGPSRMLKSENLIQGISSIDEIDLLTIHGSGLVGVLGISSRLFTAIAKEKINIILITQASSEYSITFAISPENTEKAVSAIKKEFVHEIEYLKSIRVAIEKDLSIIAIVGERMRHTPGISAKLFRALGRNGINVIAIAQGSSELNISVVITRHSLRKALNVIHEEFFLSHYKELHLYLVGTGTVGSRLLNQINIQKEKLLINHRLKINLVGLANSRKMMILPECIDIDNWKDLLDDGRKTDLSEFINEIAALSLRNSVFIDCTPSEAVAGLYKKLFNSYVSVVTANKIACSSAYSNYRDLKSTAQSRGVRFIYETNVGAGLPIINTINDLINSGDRILELQAVLSGTVNFIFNTISEEIPLSEAIRMAKEKGYSEPDPRIDLSGKDVARKILILSRESGYRIDEKDIELEPVLPPNCFKGSMDDFWKSVRALDKSFEKERKQLEKEGKKWRYVARLKNGKASVKLAPVPSNHPIYPVEGSNNVIMITTERYKELPMIIKGYGAGAEVTAAGIFADVIRIANI